jgi:hypothetical protein
MLRQARAALEEITFLVARCRETSLARDLQIEDLAARRRVGTFTGLQATPRWMHPFATTLLHYR